MGILAGFRPAAAAGAAAGAGSGRERDWMQIYGIYGIESHWKTLSAFLLFHAALFAALSFLLLLYFSPLLSLLASLLHPTLPFPLLRFLLGFLGSVAAISSVCLLYAAANIFHSSLALHWDMCQRVVSAVPDWSSVRTALDVGCGRGILLNSVAMQLKKEGSRGRVVGLDHRRETAVAALRTACVEGVQEYVTCREGDARRLPFEDGYFDVVVSAVHLSGMGSKGSSAAAAAAAARVGEMVRVLKGGGTGVVWDVGCVPEYVQRLREMRMEEIRVSERVTAYMVSSHIVSFRKPEQQNHHHRPLDWRANILC